MTKKQRVDPVEWLTSVIDLLLKNQRRVAEVDLYAELGVKCTHHTESLIFEHPSLHLMGDYVHFGAFCNVSHQMALLSFLRTAFPTCYRRIDLYGLYPFICADIDELIFTKKLHVIDCHTQSLCALPVLETPRCPELRERWRQRVGLDGESSLQQGIAVGR